MGTTRSLVIKQMAKMDDNPLEFNELVVAWNELCEQSWSEDINDFHFSDIENAAIAALSSQPDGQRSGRIGNEISRMLSTFDYPTFLVTGRGRVAATNTAASVEFKLEVGDRIDELPFSLNASESLLSLVSNKLQHSELGDSDALLMRAYGKGNEKEATIAISSSLGDVPTALVFVITTQWKPESAELLKRQFGLTEAEGEILINFVDGYSSQDIAQHRNRSHATIRTQFQSILTKTGACNQTELLRIALSVSDFVKDIGLIADAANHPHRRQAEVLRKGGRLVEVTLMGDFSGDPVFTIANLANYTFNAQTEQALCDAGLYIISMCPPGCGRTDAAPQQANRSDYMAEDASAVLDQLGISACPMLAYNANSPLCYTVVNKIPDRMTHIAHVAAVPPIKFLKSTKTMSPWITGLLRSRLNHPAMKKVLFAGIVKAWVTIGAKQFMRLQMASNPADAKHILLPENLLDYEHALKTMTRGGIASAADDMRLTIEDWSLDVDTLPVKVTVLHGIDDKLYSIEMLRAFAAAYPSKISLIELKGASFPLMQSHPHNVIELLKEISGGSAAQRRDGDLDAFPNHAASIANAWS